MVKVGDLSNDSAARVISSSRLPATGGQCEAVGSGDAAGMCEREREVTNYVVSAHKDYCFTHSVGEGHASCE